MRIPSDMAKSDLGRTIIDELKLCYTAEPELLHDLSGLELGEKKCFGDYTLFRVVCDKFQYSYDVLYNYPNGQRSKVAFLYFGRYGEKTCQSYVYYQIENWVLYDREMLDQTLLLPEMLSLSFQHFTEIDLARDNKFNIVSVIRKLAKKDKVKVVINGKVVDKKKDIDNASLTYPLNFEKPKNPTLNIKQAKAKNNKKKGMTLCGYNKSKEIDQSSHKYYINEFYGNPKSMHRLEVHQNNEQIKNYCKHAGVVQDINLIYDQAFLDGMYMKHLSSLLHFTKGRKELDWNEILCTGKV